MTDRLAEIRARLDIERMAEHFHAIYQAEARRQDDTRHPDSYQDLAENSKEFDRVLARAVADDIRYLLDEVDRLIGFIPKAAEAGNYLARAEAAEQRVEELEKELSQTAQEAHRIKELEEALETVRDIQVGWSHPMGDEERVAAIDEVCERALHPDSGEETENE